MSCNLYQIFFDNGLLFAISIFSSSSTSSKFKIGTGVDLDLGFGLLFL